MWDGWLVYMIEFAVQEAWGGSCHGIFEMGFVCGSAMVWMREKGEGRKRWEVDG